MEEGGRLRCVVVGAGALGLGFLGPELTPGCDVTFLDIPEKLDLLGHLRSGGGYALNLTGLSLRPVQVHGVDGLCLGEHGGQIARAFHAADFVITAVGEPNLPKIAPTLAEAALRRDAERPLRILCAENGVEIAHGLRTSIEAAAECRLGAALRVGDTVMGRMCKVVAEPGPPTEPVVPGADWAIVAEPYHGIPVEEHVLGGLSGLPAAVQQQSPAPFSASEDIKMLCHNGLHAVLSCLGELRGAEFFDELRDDAELMELGHDLLLQEAAPALLRKHPSAMERNELLNYCDWILRRVTCSTFHDPIERGTRGIMRKLQPWERLVYSVRTVAELRGRPVSYAAGLAAAVIIARRTGQTELEFREVLTDFCGFSEDSDSQLIAMIESARGDIA